MTTPGLCRQCFCTQSPGTATFRVPPSVMIRRALPFRPNYCRGRNDVRNFCQRVFFKDNRWLSHERRKQNELRLAPSIRQRTRRRWSSGLAADPSIISDEHGGNYTDGGHVLEPDNLFHPFSQSPCPDLRRRAAVMRANGQCPHPDHHAARPPLPIDPHRLKGMDTPQAKEPPRLVQYECPDCGIPTYCSEDHWADDYESHLQICDVIRQTNEDDHDIRSGRFFPEFEYPGPQIQEAIVNMTNWDTFLFTRQFAAVNDERSLRQVTRLLTYPATIGSIVSELSPYDMTNNGRLTKEGVRSLQALRYNLHPPRQGADGTIRNTKIRPPAMRFFVLGARAESSLPREVWLQLSWLFPQVDLHIILIGPESMANRDKEFPLPARTAGNPFGAIVEDRISAHLKISTFVEYYHTLHTANYFKPYDPYFDCFVLFHPGLGHPASAHEWAGTLPQLLETKLPIICTGYTAQDMERDRAWVTSKMGDELDILMTPGENIFRSMGWDLNDLDPSDINCANWGVWAFRGKRYETTMKDAT